MEIAEAPNAQFAFNHQMYILKNNADVVVAYHLRKQFGNSVILYCKLSYLYYTTATDCTHTHTHTHRL